MGTDGQMFAGQIGAEGGAEGIVEASTGDEPLRALAMAVASLSDVAP
jgi:hypothetical protein